MNVARSSVQLALGFTSPGFQLVLGFNNVAHLHPGKGELGNACIIETAIPQPGAKAVLSRADCEGFAAAAVSLC